MSMVRKEKFIVNEKGEKTAVVIDIKEYQKLLEDLEDLRLIAERKDEPTKTLEEVEKELKKDACL
jgi:PHD/YefM family antitoxin component YafN of YafNO toxin-antitoxin module